MASLLRMRGGCGGRHGDRVGRVDPLDDGAGGEEAVHGQEGEHSLAVERRARDHLPVLDLW